MKKDAAHHQPRGGVIGFPYLSFNSCMQVGMGRRAEKRREMLPVNISRGFSSRFHHDGNLVYLVFM